jgi:hypothetical protein
MPNRRLNRRNLLGTIGVAPVAVAAASISAVQAQPALMGEDWTYVSISPEEAVERTYQLAASRGCMEAIATGVIELLAQKAGDPFASFPVRMMRYGAGGVGCGSLCGALNGGAAVLSLLIENRSSLRRAVAKLNQWHRETALPAYQPMNISAMPDVFPVKSESILCRESLDRWSQESETNGFPAGPRERSERCHRLTADVARCVVLLLNAELEGELESVSLA